MEKTNKKNKYIRTTNWLILISMVLITILSVKYVKSCSGTEIPCPFEYYIDALYHVGAAMTISSFLYLLCGYCLKHISISVKGILSMYLIIVVASLMLIFSSEFTSEHKNNDFNMANSAHYMKVGIDLKKYFFNEKIYTNLSKQKDNIKEYKKNIKDTVWNMFGVTITFFINIFIILLLLLMDKWNARNNKQPI